MSGFLYSIFGFMLAIGILVTVHEFGHFWVARRVGVKVLRFSVGFGPTLWSRRAADGTVYQIGAIPLGGYVKMLDENEAEVPAPEQHRAFNRQSLWKRIAVVIAGPGFNFLFAVLAYWLVFTLGTEGFRPQVGEVVAGSPAEQAGIRSGDRIVSIDGRANPTWDTHRLYILNKALSGRMVDFGLRRKNGEPYTVAIDFARLPRTDVDIAILEKTLGMQPDLPDIPAVVGMVMADSPAAAAGLASGDKIISIDGEPVTGWGGLVSKIAALPGRTVELRYTRNGVEQATTITPDSVEVEGRRIGRIGVQRAEMEIPQSWSRELRYNPLTALQRGVETTWLMSAVTVRMLARMLTREESSENISGPITIARYAGQTVQVGYDQFIQFLAMISISLGILNLLPIPILDGGHLLYYLIEAVKGRPLSSQAMMWGQQLGVVLLIGLMSLAFYNDIVRLFL